MKANRKLVVAPGTYRFTGILDDGTDRLDTWYVVVNPDGTGTMKDSRGRVIYTYTPGRDSDGADEGAQGFMHWTTQNTWTWKA